MAAAAAPAEPHLGATEGEAAPESEVATWMQEQLAAEIARLNEQGARVAPVKVKNTGLVRERRGGREVVFNRIECDTSFDFRKITQLLHSDPVDCPLKPGFKYVNVVCFSRKPIPLLIPYLYDAAAEGHDLARWLFVNNRLDEARQIIEHFDDVEADGDGGAAD